jgi:hypothetical protein
MKKAEMVAERARNKYNDAIGLAEAPPNAETRRGRLGNPVLRETVKHLGRLYSEMFILPVTRTALGPAERFATAFFSGLDGLWDWRSAREYEDDFSAADIGYASSGPQKIHIPRPGELATYLRQSTEKATGHRLVPRPPFLQNGYRGRWWPVAGAFFLTTEGGVEKWGTTSGKMPELHHTDPKEDD